MMILSGSHLLRLIDYGRNGKARIARGITTIASIALVIHVHDHQFHHQHSRHHRSDYKIIRAMAYCIEKDDSKNKEKEVIMIVMHC
jgi:hypothetical protein